MTMSRKAKALQFADEGLTIQITGRHLEVTDSMKNYAMEKASKIEKFCDRITDINLILDIQKLEHKAEVIVKVGNTKITSSAITNDMYASIDLAIAKIETQVNRYNKRLHDYHAKSKILLEKEMNVNVIRRPTEKEMDEEIIDMSGPDTAREILEQEKRTLKMLTMDEALVKMELSGDVFMIFKSQEDQKLKVIYRRKDGNYGVIEPQC